MALGSFLVGGAVVAAIASAGVMLLNGAKRVWYWSGFVPFAGPLAVIVLWVANPPVMAVLSFGIGLLWNEPPPRHGDQPVRPEGEWDSRTSADRLPDDVGFLLSVLSVLAIHARTRAKARAYVEAVGHDLDRRRSRTELGARLKRYDRISRDPMAAFQREEITHPAGAQWTVSVARITAFLACIKLFSGPDHIETEAGELIQQLGETDFVRAMAPLTSEWRTLTTDQRALLVEAFGYYPQARSDIDPNDAVLREMRRLNRRTGWAPPHAG